MSLFDIIIPTYQNLEELKHCLQGFCKQTLQDSRILLCIDNNPDKVNTYLTRNNFSVDIISLHHRDGKRHGSNATRNLALPHLQSEYLLLFDSDIIPSPQLLEQHYELLGEQDCLSLGDVIYKNRGNNFLADYVQSRGKNRFRDREILPYTYITSQNLAMKSDYFIQMGGQDPAIRSYGGDIEFAYRLDRQVSVPVINNKRAVSYTTWNKSMDNMLGQMQEFGSVTLPYIKQKHPELKKAFRIDLVTAAGFKKFLLKLSINSYVARIFPIMLHCVPASLRKMMIHYLFFQSIVKGYDSGQKK